MASNREERQQMRQRGAALRKTKAVDFGFSLFGSAPAPEESSEPTSQPVGLAIVAEPVAPPQITSAPETTQPPHLSPVRRPSALHDQGSSQRTPGSARNGLRERPSMFDIPEEEELELGRSSKRRKIESPSRIPKPSISANGARNEISDSQPVQNGNTSSKAEQQQHNEAAVIPPGTSIEQPAEQSPQEPPDLAPPPEPEDIVSGQTEPAEVDLQANGEKEQAPEVQEDLPQPKSSVSPRADSASGKRERRKSPRSPPETVAHSEGAGEDTQQPIQSTDVPEQPQKSLIEAEDSRPQREIRKRGRPPASAQPFSATNTESAQELVQESVQESAQNETETTSAQDKQQKAPRSRRIRNRQPTPEVTEESDEPNGQPGDEKAKAPPESRDDAENGEEGSNRLSQQKVGPKGKRKRAGRPGKVRSPPENEQEVPQPSGRDTRQRAQLEAEPEAEPEPEPEPEREPSNEPESSTRPALTSGSKRRRGRPSLSSRRNDSAPAQPEEGQQEMQHEVEEQSSRPTRRKTRQPRGETVPVTVHRLVNVAALGGRSGPSDSSAEEEDSADELSTRQRTKLPSRGGVNPADVLSQICRETLEKTLTTLKNGIENESNAARRSEWTHKKKAVEAFGAELEGRLFELSETLDSNFVLSVQLKKAKREMMDLRSRLYQVRKEREGVALQMDAVRRKHAEEENARMTRTTINNSLHSLDLALERSQNWGIGDSDGDSQADTSTTAGLEFMLRSVAENVSSSAPGAQGGLLNQIKAFNKQLEVTARRLES